MSIKADFKDIVIVDEAGRIEYFNIYDPDFFDLIPKQLLGKKPQQQYSNLDEDSSTLMRAVNYGEVSLDCEQELTTRIGKVVRQTSDTYCIKNGREVVGAIELAYYDEKRDIVLGKPGELDADGKKRPAGRAGAGRSAAAEAYTMEDIVGDSEAMRDIKKRLLKIIDLESPVLFTGETGTGKELLARTIHNLSKRRKKEFIYVNCGAIPENLLESILFGVKKGSFTDAEEKPGLFSLANKGTIFLDEMNSVPVSTQGKLLRAIEEKRIRPVGGEEEIAIDVRILSSCSIDIDTLLRSSNIRKDLYFRLSVIQFELPPLRNRKEDIIPIAGHYIKKFNLEIPGKHFLGLDDEAKSFFLSYDWPGNVRELRNCIEGAFYTAQGSYISFEDVKERFELADFSAETAEAGRLSRDFFESGASLKEYMDRYEKSRIESALRANGGDPKAAAKSLGMSVQTLRYKMAN